MRSRFLLFFFSVFFLAACGQVPFLPPTATLSASSRLSQITISASDDLVFQAFAGEYYLFEGFGGQYLTVNSDGSFHLSIYSDRGRLSDDTGTFKILNGIFQEVARSDGSIVLNSLVPVKWDKRYLIELRQFDTFCQRIKNGDELAYNGIGWWLYVEVIDPKTPNPKSGFPLLADGQSACP